MLSESKKKQRAADIASAIRREIKQNILQAHDRLPAERTLAQTYTTSRATVRAALTRLQEENLVEIRPGSGTYVSDPPADTLTIPIKRACPLELIGARFALEPYICRLAVLHGRRADFDRLEQLVEKMEASLRDPSVFAKADTLFHLILAQCTGNQLLAWIIGQINSVRSQDEWKRMRQLTLDKAMIMHYSSQHRQILDAIRTREPEQAAKLMKKHLETARLSITRAIQMALLHKKI